MAGLPMIGALMGMCLGGPVGILAGVKIGGLAAVGGSILGYTGASVVSEQKELREYIDEHYEQQPELFVQTPMEEALAKRRSSRSLPELPGTGEYIIIYYNIFNIITRSRQGQPESAGQCQISCRTQRLPSSKPCESDLFGGAPAPARSGLAQTF